MIASNSSFVPLLDAASFAARKHCGQRRKDSAATPYINHPLEVGRILAGAGVDDVDVLIAALLHDTIEDTKTSAEEIASLFGENVVRLVLEVTDDKSLPKAERKRLQVVMAPLKSDGAKMIKIADKIANLRDLEGSPPDWSPQRIRSYRQWAGQVVRACRGVNSRLDDQARALIDRSAQT